MGKKGVEYSTHLIGMFHHFIDNVTISETINIEIMIIIIIIHFLDPTPSIFSLTWLICQDDSTKELSYLSRERKCTIGLETVIM